MQEYALQCCDDGEESVNTLFGLQILVVTLVGTQ